MRTRFLLTLILIVLIGGTACNRSSKLAKQSIFMKRATGFAYEVLVVMDRGSGSVTVRPTDCSYSGTAAE